MIKVAINGFGRIGRVAFREMILSDDFERNLRFRYDRHTLFSGSGRFSNVKGA